VEKEEKDLLFVQLLGLAKRTYYQEHAKQWVLEH
jgi:hypothetical protein